MSDVVWKHENVACSFLLVAINQSSRIAYQVKVENWTYADHHFISDRSKNRGGIRKHMHTL
jgi:hypothetical protein